MASYSKVRNAGTAHGVSLDAKSELLNLIEFHRPQVNTNLPSGASNAHLSVTSGSGGSLKDMSFYGVNMESFNDNEADSTAIPRNFTWLPATITAESLPEYAILPDVEKPAFQKRNGTYAEWVGSDNTARRLIYKFRDEIFIVAQDASALGDGAGTLTTKGQDRRRDQVEDSNGDNLNWSKHKDGGEERPAQDLSTISANDGRIYRHNGSSPITADGAPHPRQDTMCGLTRIPNGKR